MPAARKARCDSPLKSLPPEKREAVAALCQEHGFARAAPLVAQMLGSRAGTSPAALQRFFVWQRVESALERTRGEAAAFEELLLDRPELALDAERARAVGQMLFERRVMESGDTDLMLAWAKDRREAEKLRLEAARLELERGKFERLVLERLDDLIAARSSAEARGLSGEEAVAAVREALWGQAVEGVS